MPPLGFLSPVHTVAEKWLSPNSATVSLLWDSLTFLRQCGQGFTGTRRGDHIWPVLRQLQWLPAERRVDFKLACFVYSSLSNQAPPYLADDIHLVSEGSRRRLRSSTDRSCAVPRTHDTFGDRSCCSASGPRVRNSLPVHLCDEDIR